MWVMAKEEHLKGCAEEDCAWEEACEVPATWSPWSLPVADLGSLTAGAAVLPALSVSASVLDYPTRPCICLSAMPQVVPSEKRTVNCSMAL